jgi:hypothetical protein
MQYGMVQEIVIDDKQSHHQKGRHNAEYKPQSQPWHRESTCPCCSEQEQCTEQVEPAFAPVFFGKRLRGKYQFLTGAYMVICFFLYQMLCIIL